MLSGSSQDEGWRCPQSAISRIRNVSREGERARRLSTSFCWICLIKNDRRERRRRSRERAGAAELASGLWQLLCTFQTAYEGQLSVAEAPQEVASLLGQGCQTWARSGNLSCCCVIVREKCANRAQPKQKPSEALPRPAPPLPTLAGQKVSLQVCLLYESQVASTKWQVASCVLRAKSFTYDSGINAVCPAASLLLLLATSCR